MIEVKNSCIFDNETGEVYCDNYKPRFSNLKYEDYKKKFNTDKSIRFLIPMKAEELLGDKLEKVLCNEYTIAEQKWDGHRALVFMTMEANRIFSRNISKQTRWFSENTDQMPHIRDIVCKEFQGTVLDGEITVPVKNCSCRDVQSVTGALPETAVENQKNIGFAIFNAFDILYYKGINVQHMPLWKRKVYLCKVIHRLNVPYMKMCKMYATGNSSRILCDFWRGYDAKMLPLLLLYLNKVNSYKELYSDMIKRGDEGIILKDISKEYEQKRSKNFVKMKGHNTYDCVIIGYEEPTAEVDLKERKTSEGEWLYWENYEHDISTKGLPKNWPRDECCPVSKFYALKWIGAIHIGVFKTFYKDKLTKEDKDVINKACKLGDFAVVEDDYVIRALVQVGRCSGLDDRTRELISTNKERYLGRVVEVEAQHIINSDTGSLQHPRFIQFRVDKNADDCTFEDHIRRYGEEDVHR